MRLIPDETLLDQLWDNWETRDLTIQDLLDVIPEVEDESVVSEVWHLISVKALELTKKHALNSLKDNVDQAWVHDNVIFGSGNANLDFNKKVRTNVIDFYVNRVKEFPDSLISRRILIEAYLDMMLLEKAEQEIASCINRFPEKNLLETYQCELLFLKGLHKEAVHDLNRIVSSSTTYVVLLSAAEIFTKMGMFERAYEVYSLANRSQTVGSRKIDALESQINIIQLIDETDRSCIKKHIEEILEIYRTDYGITSGDEIDEIREIALRD